MLDTVRRAALRFGATSKPESLSGGLSPCYRVGDIVLKPAPHADEVSWLGAVFDHFYCPDGVRLPRPIRSLRNEWSEDGWMAWTWLAGEFRKGANAEKLSAARALHQGLSGLSKPDFFESRVDPWALADRVAWGERIADYPAEFLDHIRPLLSACRDDGQPRQAVHADLTANFVLADGLAPGIIDLTIYWRPAAFAEAIMLVDSIWQGPEHDLSPFRTIPNWRQMTLRAVVRRMAEQAEQVAAGVKTRDAALAYVSRLSAAAPRLLEGPRRVRWHSAPLPVFTKTPYPCFSFCLRDLNRARRPQNGRACVRSEAKPVSRHGLAVARRKLA